MKILDDGSMEGTTFSEHFNGKQFEYPHPDDNETFIEYKERVDKLKEQGFHLGDLSWGDWHIYCAAGGHCGVDPYSKIGDDD